MKCCNLLYCSFCIFSDQSIKLIFQIVKVMSCIFVLIFVLLNINSLEFGKNWSAGAVYSDERLFFLRLAKHA